MKSFVKALIILCCFLTVPLMLFAQDRRDKQIQQDRRDEQTPGSYFPDYQIEVFHDTATLEDVILPFIYNGYLYTFSLDKGLLLWRIFIGGDLANPFTVKDRNLYLYDIYNRVYSIDIVYGVIRWKIEIQNEIKGKISLYGNLLLVSTQWGYIYVMNAENGKTVYEFSGKEDINTSFQIYKNLMIVPHKNGKVTAYNMDTKSIEWVFYSGGIISVSPVIKDGHIYFGDWDDTFYALDALTGKPLWVSYVGENISRDFIVFDKEIILFFSKGQIICLAKDNGEIEWVKYFKNVEFSYNYFAGEDKFYIFTPDFIAIEPEDGQVIFNYRERAFNFYKEMLFENMIEGEHPLSAEDRIRFLSEIYFTVSNYPLLPPVKTERNLIYFVTDNSYFYVYDPGQDFFILKYKLN